MARKRNDAGNTALGDPTYPFLSDVVKGVAVQVTPNGTSFGADDPTANHLINDNTLYGFRGGGWQQGAMHRARNVEVEEDREVYGGNRSGE